MTKRRTDIDCLKGIAILFVILYHMGFVDTGYLGVDIFFVISGYFVLPKLWRNIIKGDFKLIQFISGKYVRFAPLVLLVVGLSLLLGIMTLLPNQIKVLSETSVASIVFLQNVFAMVVSGNYWDVQNSYSPLLHFWYVGVAFQFYVVMPILLMGLYKIVKNRILSERLYCIILIFIIVISIALNVIEDSEIIKFYGLPYRAYEFCLGGLMPSVFQANRLHFSTRNKQFLSYSSLIVLIMLLVSCFFYRNLNNDTEVSVACFNTFGQSNLLPRNILTLITSLCTCTVVSFGFKLPKLVNVFAYLGTMSYSLYVWHQFVLAFTRNLYTNEFSFVLTIIIAAIVFLLSLLSYYFIEKKISLSRNSLITCLIVSVLLIGASLYVYTKNGVLRDYPEMDITVENAHSGMYGEYCDRVYRLNEDFPKNNCKKNVLIIGNSFARDFANVVLESAFRDSINISYCFRLAELKMQRFNDADIICYHGLKEDLLAYSSIGNKRVFGIGTKNYGESISVIYSRRFKQDYYDTTVPVVNTILLHEKRLIQSWGDNYISFLSPVLVNENSVKVFTENKKLISFDCRHLSKAGAIYYADKLDLNSVFNMQ